jgi:hypothetical protein
MVASDIITIAAGVLVSVAVGLRIGWVIWGQTARNYQAYRLAYESVVDKLTMFSTGKITSMESVQMLSALGVESAKSLLADELPTPPPEPSNYD